MRRSILVEAGLTLVTQHLNLGPHLHNPCLPGHIDSGPCQPMQDGPLTAAAVEVGETQWDEFWGAPPNR